MRRCRSSSSGPSSPACWRSSCPNSLIPHWCRAAAYLAIGFGGVLGLIFPMCECGIIPVMRRLLRKGLPLSCCVAYMLAGPIINVVVLLSTFAAFSRHGHFRGRAGRATDRRTWMMGLRAGLGYLVAVVTALIVERQHRSTATPC